jgi:hypothetical protein
VEISEVGVKCDEGKSRVDLLDPEFLLEMGRVMTFGAQKYGDRNWENGISYSRLFGALLRHVLKFWKGEDIDKESKCKTLAHVAVNAMMLAGMPPKWDNRSVTESSSNLDTTIYMTEADWSYYEEKM